MTHTVSDASWLDGATATWQETRDFLRRCPYSILPLGATEHRLFYGTRDGVVIRVDAETRREIGRISVASEPVTGARDPPLISQA